MTTRIKAPNIKLIRAQQSLKIPKFEKTVSGPPALVCWSSQKEALTGNPL